MNSDRTAQEIMNAKVEDIWRISKTERRSLYNFWSDSFQSASLTFRSAVTKYNEVKKFDDAARQEIDLRCLADADIVGLTTSGLARNLELLKRVPMKVVLIEEAGEILEAHTLTALLPDVEHAILVGDHLQLKPSVDCFKLSSESHGGAGYSLDMSLFERLVSPPEGLPSIKLPCSTLGTQRRMRPSISSILRQTLYPELKDDASVEQYPDVAGMRQNVYWLDHDHLETGAGAVEQASMSKSSKFEVDYVVGLAAHLLSQGVYKPKDIAVITPYLGQLFKLRTALSAISNVALDDRDKAQLQQYVTQESEWADPEKENTSLLDALKVATVDNFQGEEAKVVIVSLVRSNKSNQCGFLKTTNRINVLLSSTLR